MVAEPEDDAVGEEIELLLRLALHVDAARDIARITHCGNTAARARYRSPWITPAPGPPRARRHVLRHRLLRSG